MKNGSVAAVVVTFNRLLLLQECIEALRIQTRPLDTLLIVDNSSTDGTGRWLAQQPDLLVVTQENKGGASGFYTGLHTAFEMGHEWIWCMDDDGKPAHSAIEKLLQYSHRKPCVMNSLVLNKDNPQEILFSPLNLHFVSQISTPTLENVGTFFNATLFHRQVIEKAGFPLKELIIWGDETEYAFRLNHKYGFPLFTVTDSYHSHPAQYSKFYKKEWTLDQGWKIYFFIRNKRFVYESKYNSQFKAIATYILFLSAFFALIVLRQKKQKSAKLKLFKRAATDGFAKNTTTSLSEIQGYIAALNAKPLNNKNQSQKNGGSSFAL